MLRHIEAQYVLRNEFETQLMCLSWRHNDITPGNRVTVQAISAEDNTAQMAKGPRSSFKQLEKLGEGTYGTVRPSHVICIL